MQDVVAYLMHVDGRHLQTVLNPAMHAHSQVLSAPSVNTEPSHSIRVIHGPSYGPIALASTGAGCPELSPPSGFHETERRLGAVGHIAVQLAHLLQEVRATVDVRTGSHLRSDCADASETAPRLRRDSRRICAATRAASAPRLHRYLVVSIPTSDPRHSARADQPAMPRRSRSAARSTVHAELVRCYMIHTHAHTRLHARLYAQARTHTPAHPHTPTHARLRMHAHARSRTHARPRAHARTPWWIYAYGSAGLSDAPRWPVGLMAWRSRTTCCNRCDVSS